MTLLAAGGLLRKEGEREKGDEGRGGGMQGIPKRGCVWVCL